MLNRVLLSACLTLGVAAPAITVSQTTFAADAERSKNAGELDRLVEELQKHLQKPNYKAANEDFEKLLKLKHVAVPAKAFFWGAQAAINLGHIGDTIARYEQAKKAGHTGDNIDTLVSDLKTRYGQVDIKKQKKGERALKAVVNPFAPDENRAIEFASTTVADHGKFEGWLPVGEYLLGEQKFTVVSGKTVKVKR